MQSGKFIAASEINEINNDSLFPCYGGNGLRGYTKLHNCSGEYSLIGRQGAHCGNVTLAKGKFYATEHALIVTLSRDMDTVWAFYLLKNLNLNQYATGLAQPGLSVQKLEQVDTKTPPSLPEQQKIASFLTAIDAKIELLTKKKALLEQYKKGVMQHLFSQKIRFKDEDGNEFPEWEEKTLGEITYKVDKKNKNNEILPVYSISNINGFVPQSEQFDGVDSNERGYNISLYKIVEKETFAYNPARINVGSIGYSGNLEKVIVSSLYVCFKTKDVIDDSFVNYFLQTEHFKNSVLKNGEGGVRIYLFYENFSAITIQMPSIKEQILIIKFLSAIDTKIDLAKRQIEITKSYKEGLLQQLFV